MKTGLKTALGLLSALSLTAGMAQAADETDTAARTCLDLKRIDHTEVVDDQNILFYTRGGGIFLNRLAHSVPGLDRNQPFMYKTSIGQLCNNDFITVLERWGFGLTQGASGALGKFLPIDEARAQALKTGESADVRFEPVDPDQ